MKLKLQHIIGISLVFCGWLGFASCTDESFESPREEEDNSIFLTFRTAVAGASTRNPDGSSEADAEIRQLLVVIVSEEKTEESTESAGNATQWGVEHSRLITKEGASIGIPLSDEYTFEVTTGCRKRIYLIANHNGLKDADGNPLGFGSNSFIPGANGIVPVEDFVFALDWDKANGYKYNPDEYGIPMTAMYEINVPAIKDLPENTDEYKLGDLYVVRAATKYSFNFKNTSAHRNIQVNSVDIEKVITDRMYLMPHVNKEKDNEDGTDKYWVVSDKATEKKYLQNKTNSWFTNREWIDWMVEEAKKTNGNATLPGDNEEWLTDYKVPAGETSTYNMKYTDPVKVPANTDKKEEKDLDFVSSSQYFYLPESCSQENEPDEQKRQLKLQKYTLTVHTTETFEGNGNKNSREENYTAPLPHLASLFRNTHVKVNIVFNDYDVDWQVDVEPYWEVKLDPEFGLDVPDTTTPEQPTNPDPSGDNSGE